MSYYYIERFTLWLDNNMSDDSRLRLWKLASDGHLIKCFAC